MSVRTWKDIKWKAKECKKNVESKYTLGMVEQWGYYFAKAIVTPYKDIKRNKSLGKSPKPIGDKVKMRIPKADYVKLAKDLIYFCEKKNRTRNYLDYKGKRIRCRLYVYMFAKIIAYRSEHNDFPNYVDIDYKAFYPPEKPKTVELHDYLLEEGCSELGQCTGYYCACNSLQQCFYRLTGVHVSEHDIADWAGTTSDGTDHDGINTAVSYFNKKYGKNVKITWYNFSELNWNKILDFIKNGAVFFHLLYRDQWGHYEPIKWVGDDLEILNSLGDGCGSGTYCGYIEYRGRGTQERYIGGISQKSVAVLKNG